MDSYLDYKPFTTIMDTYNNFAELPGAAPVIRAYTYNIKHYSYKIVYYENLQ